MEPASVPAAVALAGRLRHAAAELLAVIESVDPHRWSRSPGSGIWSIGKDAEHVAEAAMYHQWIVRVTVGARVSPRRPPVERSRVSSDLSPAAAAALIRVRTEEGARLLLRLTDAQLDLPTRPPRARSQRLAETIDRVLIGHYDAHRRDIEAKLRAVAE